MPSVRLMQGDCLALLKDIADESVDLVIADLPYGTTDCAWDNLIPFEPMWEQLDRICKRTAPMLFFGSEPFSTRLRMSNIDEYKYDWIWVKNHTTGFAHAKNMPLKQHENISVFSQGGVVHRSLDKGNRMTYNPQGVVEVQLTQHTRRHKFGTIAGERPSNTEYYKQEGTNYPRSVIYFDKELYPGAHPTQKPVSLLEYLIKTYSNEGETVFDPTMGSGSTGVACVNTSRNFIGIEIDENYFKTAQTRISEAKNTPKQEKST